MSGALSTTCALSTAERSYPTSEVRVRSREDPMPEGRRPRGATQRPKSGAAARVPGCDSTGAAERSYPRPRSGAAAGRSNPTSKERWLHGRRRAERSYSTFKVRRGDLVQGKEQWLRFLEQM